MDDADAAQHREEHARDAALAAARRAAAAALAGNGSDDCIDCDDPIPEERRRAVPSACRCKTCQDLYEAQQRTMRMRRY